jgi:hypothetical protein
MRSVLCGSVLLLVCMAGALAWAEPGGEVVIWGDVADAPRVPSADVFSPHAMDIGVNGVSFFTLRAPAAGFSIAQRARALDARIAEILSRRVCGPVVVRTIRGKPTIYVGPIRLVTVYPEDVRAAGACCAFHLARAWAASVAAGLRRVMPGLAGPVSGLYTVALNNQLLFRLRWSDGYPSVARRGRVVEQRVAEALSRRAREVSLTATRDGCVVLADGQPVVEATWKDAELAGTSPQALATSWAANLRRALSLIAAPTARARGASSGAE